jgi:hypothetical protein
MTLQSEYPFLFWHFFQTLSWIASLKILAFQKPFLLITLENIGLAGRHTFPGLGRTPSGNGALIAVQAAIMSYL